MLRTLFQKSLLYFATLVFGKLLSAVYFFVIARILLPEKFGEIMLFVTLLQLVTTLADVGLKNWYLKVTAQKTSPDLLAQLFGWRQLFYIISVLIFLLLQWWRGWLASDVIPYFFIALWFESLVTVADAYYLSQEKSIVLGAKLIIRNVLLFASFYFIHAPSDIVYFYQAYILAWVIILAFYFPWRPLWHSLRVCQHWSNCSFLTTWPYAAIDSLGVIYSRADQLIIKTYLSSTLLGIYSAAYRYLDAFNLLPQALFHNLFPLAAKKGGIKARQIIKMVVIMTGLGVLVGCSMIFGSQFLTVTLLGEAYAPAAGVLRLFSLVIVLFFFNAPLNTILQSSDHVHTYVPYLLASTIFNLSLNYLLVPHFGMYGSVWAMIGGESLLVIMNTYLVWRQYHR